MMENQNWIDNIDALDNFGNHSPFVICPLCKVVASFLGQKHNEYDRHTGREGWVWRYMCPKCLGDIDYNDLWDSCIMQFDNTTGHPFSSLNDDKPWPSNLPF
jgi:hypothetical protein